MNTLLGFAALLLSMQTVPADGAPRITQADFKKLVAANNVIVVDTRTPDAFAKGHIPGAIVLPLEGLAVWPPEYQKTVDTLKGARKQIVTYCA